MKRRELSIQISPRRKIACEEYSKGDRSKSSKFIAIHGWLDNLATWFNFVPDFISKMENATVLCIDLAGHGNSSHRDSRTYLLTDYVIDVYRVVQTLGWKRFGLIGRMYFLSVRHENEEKKEKSYLDTHTHAQTRWAAA